MISIRHSRLQPEPLTGVIVFHYRRYLSIKGAATLTVKIYGKVRLIGTTWLFDTVVPPFHTFIYLELPT